MTWTLFSEQEQHCTWTPATWAPATCLLFCAIQTFLGLLCDRGQRPGRGVSDDRAGPAKKLLGLQLQPQLQLQQHLLPQELVKYKILVVGSSVECMAYNNNSGQ